MRYEEVYSLSLWLTISSIDPTCEIGSPCQAAYLLFSLSCAMTKGSDFEWNVIFLWCEQYSERLRNLTD